jgi:hypothetical protein
VTLWTPKTNKKGSEAGATCRSNQKKGQAMNGKIVTVLLCVLGIWGVSYGMYTENNTVFIMGLLSVIGGYLLIRRGLKEALKKKS